MKGDFSRDSFRPGKRYTSVRLQQGRVLLDADWNEQADIQRHLDLVARRDTVGLCGGPKGTGPDGLSLTGFDIQDKIRLAGCRYPRGILKPFGLDNIFQVLLVDSLSDAFQLETQRHNLVRYHQQKRLPISLRNRFYLIVKEQFL